MPVPTRPTPNQPISARCASARTCRCGSRARAMRRSPSTRTCATSRSWFVRSAGQTVEGVLASDASSVPVQMWAAARDGSAFVILRQDGTYSVKFVPRIKGAFWIRVSLANEEVAAAAAVAWPTVRTRRPPRRVLGKAWLHECSAPAGLGFDAQYSLCAPCRSADRHSK